NHGKRHRADKADFEIAVYDRVMKGELFRAIALKLRRPVSSVKSAYLAACRNIYGSGPPRRKRDMRQEGFDPGDHSRTCRVCRVATGVDDMCAAARAYTNQDYRGGAELPVGLDVLVRPGRQPHKD